MDTEITARRARTELLRRADGESVYRVAKAQLYTSPAVLAAEARIVTAAGRTDGRRVRAADVELAELEWSANSGGRVLNTGQAAMVREIATSGRRVQLALAPAGTGKTTVMGVLAAAWRNGGGTVVGLAPQASAAAGTRRRDPRGAGGHPGQTGPRPHHPHPRQMAAVDDRPSTRAAW